MSRNLEDQFKFQTPSLAEIKDGLISAANRAARRVKFRGRKLRHGPMLNAIVARFLTLPEEQQAREVAQGIAIVERLMESDEPRDDLLVASIQAVGPSDHEGRIKVIPTVPGPDIPRKLAKPKKDGKGSDGLH